MPSVHDGVINYFYYWSLSFTKSETNDTSAFPKGSGYLLEDKLWVDPLIILGGAVGSAPARTAGGPDLNLGPRENCSLKLTTRDLSDG